MGKLLEELKKIWKNLVSFYVYKISRKEVFLIVVNEMNFKEFDDVKKSLKWKNFIILTMDDVKNWSDIFALKVINLRNNSDLIFWKDVLKNIKINKSDLRHSLEFELRNKLIQLREWFLSTWWDAKFLENILPVLNLLGEWILFLYDIDLSLNKFEIIWLVNKNLKLNSDFLNVLDKKIWSESVLDFIQKLNNYLLELLKKIDEFKN